MCVGIGHGILTKVAMDYPFRADGSRKNAQGVKKNEKTRSTAPAHMT